MSPSLAGGFFITSAPWKALSELGKGATTTVGLWSRFCWFPCSVNANENLIKKQSRMQIVKNMSCSPVLYLLQNLKVSSQTNFLSRAWWFPIFYFFEKNVQGSIPCCFSWPLSWPPGCFKSSCKKYSRVQKIGEDNEKSTWGAEQRHRLLHQKSYRCNQRYSFDFYFRKTDH